ncbi:ABC transporter substrate-binding protein [Paenibacillus sp. NPDC058174]|uniref:ABC transporter substrate-binding protein n=1 Tax=Paenibacillus sp. NPDC058174 TaxID=3346366 RepID=UPI0036DEF8DD
MKQNKWSSSWLGLALLMLVLLLAACGNNNSTAAGNNNVPPAAAATADSSADGTTASTTKIVSTKNGDIEIPVKPMRIVTDDYLGSLIALGVTPVGTPGLHLKNLYFAEALKGVEDIGDYGNVSLEKILALQPDLIITAENDPAKYDNLSKAAPTISVPYGDLKNAREELTYFGKLLGREQEAEAWLAAYEDRLAKAREQVDQAIPPEATFTIFEDVEKAVYVYGDNFGRGGQPIYQALGRKPPSGVAAEIMEKQYVELSKEMMTQYAGDYIILTSNSRTLEDYKKDPLWNTLDAVKNDRLYVWKEERSWYYDPIAVLSQTEELAAWLSQKQ